MLLLIVALGASWFLVRNLDTIAGDFTNANRAHNAKVLNRAKQALIGYVAAQAAKQFEDNPGALPCPEHPWYLNRTPPDDGKEGSAGPAIGISSPGGGTANCSSIGRFPWRTIGTEAFVDADGETLWYVVGPTWRKTSTSTKTVINSNTVGNLTVDGQNAVALIIAPGRVMNTQAGTTPAGVACSARNQARTSPLAYTVNPLDYLECFDSATLTFSSTGPGAAFNDQVVIVTVGDLMPGIEAAVADRMAREIAPLLKTTYVAPSWGLTGSNMIYPFAAPFGDPSTSSMQGAAGTYAGLLPFNNAETAPGSGTLCTAGPSAPRCSPTFVAWTGTATMSGGSTSGESCTVTASQINCTFNSAASTTSFTLTATASYVGMALRQLSTSTTGATNVLSMTPSATLNSDGSASVTITGTANVPSNPSNISIPITVFADHPILDTTTATNYSWFARNKWHELTYYAVGAGYSPTVLVPPAQPSCGAGCLTVSNVTPSGQDRAILILGGRSINGSPRPSTTLANYLEFGNASGSYERQPASTEVAGSLKKPFNDRVVIVDCSNPDVAFPYPCDNR